MKNILLLIAISFTLLFANNLSAQNEAIYNHYHINPILVNPAAAGFNDVHIAHMNARVQWVGFPGAPRTYSMTYNGPIGKTFGFGAMVFSENIASLTRTRLQLDYSFRYQLEKMKVAFGFSTEWEQDRIPMSALDNPFYEAGGFIIEEATGGRGKFDASFGGYALLKEKTFIGISLPGLISQRIGDEVSVTEEDTPLFSYYTLMAGHRFGVDNYDFVLEPSILIKKVLNVPFQVDFNLKASFLEEKIITGISYRSGTGGAIGLLLGTKLAVGSNPISRDAFRLYYSYDVSFQRFQTYNSGSHEITVSFEFKGKKDMTQKR